VSSTLRLALNLEHLFKDEKANEASIPDEEYQVAFEGVIIPFRSVILSIPSDISASK